MVSDDTRSVIERAKRIYADQLQSLLEPQHTNRFVAIEPESGEYFLGDTFDEAVKFARRSTRPACRTSSGSGTARPFTSGACNGERIRGRRAAGTASRAGVGVARRAAHGGRSHARTH